MPVSISSNFDSGAIEIQSIERAEDVQLRIRADSHSEFRQWFHFRLQGARDTGCELHLVNAGACTYVSGWRGYSAAASYDRVNWFRVPTHFDGTVMTISHTPRHDSVYYAYFEPYSWERHLELLGRVQECGRARVTRLGGSVEGRDIDLVTIGGDCGDRLPVWI
ncbi:MAG: M14-type cytosolic carboxypeptidase, partial [Pseudomonadota bacterium]|nr:M14-type cytosolic carboxypeptidase [Pseudomonadota bacterium]